MGKKGVSKAMFDQVFAELEEKNRQAEQRRREKRAASRRELRHKKGQETSSSLDIALAEMERVNQLAKQRRREARNAKSKVLYHQRKQSSKTKQTTSNKSVTHGQSAVAQETGGGAIADMEITSGPSTSEVLVVTQPTQQKSAQQLFEEALAEMEKVNQLAEEARRNARSGKSIVPNRNEKMSPKTCQTISAEFDSDDEVQLLEEICCDTDASMESPADSPTPELLVVNKKSQEKRSQNFFSEAIAEMEKANQLAEQRRRDARNGKSKVSNRKAKESLTTRQIASPELDSHDESLLLEQVCYRSDSSAESPVVSLIPEILIVTPEIQEESAEKQTAETSVPRHLSHTSNERIPTRAVTWEDVRACIVSATLKEKWAMCSGKENCTNCSVDTAVIECSDGCDALCISCDSLKHTFLSTHLRHTWFGSKTTLQPCQVVRLLQDGSYCLDTESRAIPIKAERHCRSCGSQNLSNVVDIPCVFVSLRGRHDTYLPAFKCESCLNVSKVEWQNLISSNYFAGSPVIFEGCYIFSTEVLRNYYCSKLENPSCSIESFLSVLQRLSEVSNVTAAKICPTAFKDAFEEWTRCTLDLNQSGGPM